MECTASCRLKAHGDYLVSAFSSENIDTLKNILKRKCANPLRVLDARGRSVLHIVASLGGIDVLQWLSSEYKLSNFLQAKDKESGYTPLHRAILYGHIDCAFYIYKLLNEWKTKDNEGHSPLDLLILESPHSNKQRASSIPLAHAILPFEGDRLSEELSLLPGDVIEVINRNSCSGWTFGRNTVTREKGVFPSNFVEDVKQDNPKDTKDHFTPETSVYVWGDNVNFTLGIPETLRKTQPEVNGSLKNVVDVVMTKFHSTFLMADGKVFTCGHGLGGRLGHGSEETVIVPQLVKELKHVRCISIKAGRYHTVVLDEMGCVYTFGSNQFHQLGQTPPSTKCIFPKPLTDKIIRNKEIVGIAAANFHSVVYTKHEVFSFGLNAGQLGLSKGCDLQSVPKIVSAMCNKECSIKEIVASDGATVCLMENGDVYLLKDYVCKRIASKLPNVLQLRVTGGVLKHKQLEQKIENKLRIAVLHSNGLVDYWCDDQPLFRNCYWVGEKTNSTIVHIHLGAHLLLTTSNGQIFIGYFQNNASFSANTTPVKSVEVVSKQFSLRDLIEKHRRAKAQCQHIQLERLAYLSRAMQCYSDPKSRSFVVVQNDPRIGLTLLPKVGNANLKKDLEELCIRASESDNIHDILIKSSSELIPAHRFILQCAGLPLVNLTQIRDKQYIDFSTFPSATIIKWLRNLYKGEMVKRKPCVEVSACQSTGDDVQQDDDKFLMNKMASLYSIDIDPFGEEVISHQKKKKKSPSKKQTKKKQAEGISHKNFQNWQDFVKLSDVTIHSVDGACLKAHKCILVARSEYFSSMLSNNWMESLQTINMDVPADVLHHVLQFIYTGTPWQQVPDEISFIGEVMICSDQLLLARLKQICELDLANKVSLENALEMFSFACSYNSQQLVQFVGGFISINLPHYIEHRLLDGIEIEDLTKLSQVYRSLVNGMESRVIEPTNVHTDIDNKEKEEMATLNAHLNSVVKRKRQMSLNSKDVIKKSMEDEVNCPTPCINNVKQQPNANNYANVTKVQADIKTALPRPVIIPQTRDTRPRQQISPFKKKSQKQRRRESEEEKATNDVTPSSDVTPSKDPAKNPSPWKSTPQKCDAVSFRHLLHEDKYALNQGAKKMGKFSKTSQQTRKSFSEEAQTSPLLQEESVWGGAWSNAPVMTSSNMAQVQHEDEQQQDAESIKKPVTSIQMEERAIEELRNHYVMLYPSCEISVERVLRKTSIPCWERQRNDSLL